LTAAIFKPVEQLLAAIIYYIKVNHNLSFFAGNYTLLRT